MEATLVKSTRAADSYLELEAYQSLLRTLKADYVAIFNAYFDESGTHKESKVTCVGGYIFEAEQSLRFDEEWRTALREYGIHYFHMVECAHGTGQFKSLSGQDRIELEKRLIGAIKRRARIGIVASVQEADYRQAVPAEIADIGGAYMACLVYCVLGVAAWVAKHRETGNMAYFFESGHPLQPTANRAMYDLAQNEVLREGCSTDHIPLSPRLEHRGFKRRIYSHGSGMLNGVTGTVSLADNAAQIFKISSAYHTSAVI